MFKWMYYTCNEPSRNVTVKKTEKTHESTSD